MPSNCFHCGLANPPSAKIESKIIGKQRHFCCLGCLAIAETLTENGLTDFYRFRSGLNITADELIPSELESIEAFDSPDILKQISQLADDGKSRSIELGIEGITCAACGWLIEKSIGQLESVVKINVNVSTQRANLTWIQSTSEHDKSINLSHIIKTFNQVGFKAYPFSEDERIASFKRTNQQFIKRLVVASIGMMQVMTYALSVYIGDTQDISPNHRSFMHWLSFIVATPVVFYSATPFFKSAWNNLKAKRLGMNFPVSLAILSAYFSSIYSLLFNKNDFYFDSVVMFTFFLLIGRFLEHRARYLSVLKQTNFQQLIPISVKKIIDEQPIDIPVSEVEYGDKLIIPAGAIIPVDGVLLENSAEINEAIMTGEFLPISKQPNDELISGSTNQSAALTMLVSKNFTRSKISQLIDLQRKAENLKPNSISIADKISHWYVVGLLIILFAVSIVWWFIDSTQVFSIALSILVVSCPCALSLATPAALAAATSQLTDLGFMIRNSSTLTELNKVKQIFFDKTGTLTEGKISINKVENYSDYTEQQLISFATLLENISSHPIAIAFKYYLEDEQSASNNPNSEKIVLTNHQEIIGKGVIANINKKRYLLGKVSFLIEDNKKKYKNNYVDKEQHDDEIRELKTAYRKHKGMAIFLSEDGKLIAKFHLADKIKSSASKCISKLKESINVSLLTGDSDQSAMDVGTTLKIEDIIANASPENKLKAIQRAQQKDKVVMMVGDGFNDLGALASADISISLASSPDLSKSKSDVVLVSEDLMVIPKAIELSKKVQMIIKQNLGWAIAYNLLAIPFAALGYIPAWLAAIGMSLSSLVVVLNALRLKK